MPAQLSILGCGKLGKTLGLLLKGVPGIELCQVLNRSLESSTAAVRFLGAGAAVSDYQALAPADYLLVGVPDDAIAGCAAWLAQSEAIRPGTIVFHCSGSQSASVLAAVKDRGALIASIHPIRSFADPALAAASFSGTGCALEGDPPACETLAELFRSLGAKVFPIAAPAKLVYHAGTVFASNYLTVLIETGLRCFEQAGIERSQAMECLLPLLEGTLANNRQLGPARALTGPIARGEETLVARQVEALQAWNPKLAALYKALGLGAVELAAEQGAASREAMERIRSTLGRGWEIRRPKSEIRKKSEARSPKSE